MELEKDATPQVGEKTFSIAFFILPRDEQLIRKLPHALDKARLNLKKPQKIRVPIAKCPQKIRIELTIDPPSVDTSSNASSRLLNFILSSPRDITIEGNDNFKLQVHSLILMAGSKVFRSMLEHDTEEKKNSIIRIKDFDNDIITAMVDYLYSKKVVDFHSLSLILLTIADKYEIEGLIEMCERHLIQTISLDTVSSILKTADAIGNKNLKERCFDFLCPKPLLLGCPAELRDTFLQTPSLYCDLLSRVFKSKEQTASSPGVADK